jgi:hypothetical protein
MKIFAGVAFLVSVCITLISAPGFSQERGKRFEACKADIDKFCADVPRGQHKTRPCLEENKDKLSSECKAAIETPRENK